METFYLLVSLPDMLARYLLSLEVVDRSAAATYVSGSRSPPPVITTPRHLHIAYHALTPLPGPALSRPRHTPRSIAHNFPPHSSDWGIYSTSPLFRASIGSLTPTRL